MNVPKKVRVTGVHSDSNLIFYKIVVVVVVIVIVIVIVLSDGCQKWYLTM